jgi:hypothetical protein
VYTTGLANQGEDVWSLAEKLMVSFLGHLTNNSIFGGVLEIMAILGFQW